MQLVSHDKSDATVGLHRRLFSDVDLVCLDLYYNLLLKFCFVTDSYFGRGWTEEEQYSSGVTKKWENQETLALVWVSLSVQASQAHRASSLHGRPLWVQFHTFPEIKQQVVKKKPDKDKLQRSNDRPQGKYDNVVSELLMHQNGLSPSLHSWSQKEWSPRDHR